MNTRINILLLLTTLVIPSCTEVAEPVYDNPKDPQNTSAPLLAPYNLQSVYVNEAVFRVLWMEDNFTTEGFVVERAKKGSSTFTTVLTQKKEQCERIENGPYWVVYSVYDSTVKRADVEYRYRVKAYRQIPGRYLESPYSKEYTLGYP